MSPEELQALIHDYLVAADQAADTDRIAQRLHTNTAEGHM